MIENKIETLTNFYKEIKNFEEELMNNFNLTNAIKIHNKFQEYYNYITISNKNLLSNEESRNLSLYYKFPHLKKNYLLFLSLPVILLSIPLIILTILFSKLLVISLIIPLLYIPIFNKLFNDWKIKSNLGSEVLKDYHKYKMEESNLITLLEECYELINENIFKLEILKEKDERYNYFENTIKENNNLINKFLNNQVLSSDIDELDEFSKEMMKEMIKQEINSNNDNLIELLEECKDNLKINSGKKLKRKV